jgi:thiosulfate/3-mercaptopyruvate sulfurtransferase
VTDIMPLVDTAWLADRRSDPRVVPVDSSWHLPAAKRSGEAEFIAAHIPGAVYFDIDAIADRGSDLPHMLPTPRAFESAVGGLGIDNDTHVVVYDAYGLMTAGRVWWMFRCFGHERVSILDGGLPRWRHESRGLESGPAMRTPRRFAARLVRELVRDRADMIANLQTRAAQVVDARAAARFEGSAPEPRPGLRAGHIPASRNLPFDRLVDPQTKRVKPPDAIAALFRDAGIDPSGPVVATCGSGVTAAALVFGLFLTGNRRAAVYDGSWSEWGRPGDTQVATGKAA